MRRHDPTRGYGIRPDAIPPVAHREASREGIDAALGEFIRGVIGEALAPVDGSDIDYGPPGDLCDKGSHRGGASPDVPEPVGMDNGLNLTGVHLVERSRSRDPGVVDPSGQRRRPGRRLRGPFVGLWITHIPDDNSTADPCIDAIGAGGAFHPHDVPSISRQPLGDPPTDPLARPGDDHTPIHRTSNPKSVREKPRPGVPVGTVELASKTGPPVMRVAEGSYLLPCRSKVSTPIPKCTLISG